MHALVHLRTFNDIDHIAPVIWKILEKGDRVTVFFVSDYDSSTDYRIRFLSNYPNFSIYQRDESWILIKAFLIKIRSRLISNRISRMLKNKFKLGRVAYDFLQLTLWPHPILRRKRVTIAIYEWGGPGRPHVQEAKKIGIPTVVLPHGLTIFKNYDINESIKKRKIETGNWPDFSNRNIFDFYVVQSRRHRNWCIDWGQDSNKVEFWGSARFSPEWSSLNSEICGDFRPSGEDSNKLKVVFFMPHWEYNVDIKKAVSLLQAIGSNSNVYLAVKGHTRDSDGTFPDWSVEMSSWTNVDMSVSAHSPALIKWSDVVVSFGTSVVIDALLLGRMIANPVYLHTNTTIFDDPEISCLCENADEVMRVLSKALGGERELPSSAALNKFIENEVNGGIGFSSGVLEYYYNKIIELK